jgi:RNA polymerase sigma-70 factor (ECF subfamily)
MADSLVEFEAIYVRYHPKIVRYLARFVGWEEAEDISQEVFVKVGRSLASFRGESRISAWIYRIATNAALDRLRTPSFQTGGAEETTGGADRERENGGTWRDDRCRGSGGNSFSVERQLIRKEMNACIRNRIENLPEPYRSVLVLSELGEFSNGEIADMK